MSARCSGRVWAYSGARGSDRLVLLAIADYAKDDGSGAWPSVATLASKTKLTERAVRYALRSLEDMGELRVEMGAGPKGANLYTVLVWGDEPVQMEPEGRGANVAGANVAGGQSKTARGGKVRQLPPATFAPKPLIEPPVDPPRGLAPLFDSFKAHGLTRPGVPKQVIPVVQRLLQTNSADDIAGCWAAIGDLGTPSDFADNFMQMKRSFGYIEREDLVAKWLAWVANGSPPLHRNTRATSNGRIQKGGSPTHGYSQRNHI